jgi:hypothetical protein
MLLKGHSALRVSTAREDFMSRLSRRVIVVMTVVMTGGVAEFSATPEGRPAASPLLWQQAGVPQNPDAKAVAAFQDRIKEFVEIHKKAEAGLPRLPQEATPEQIDKNQRELGRLIREARLAARQGDLFTPDMQAFVQRVMIKLVAGPEGRQLRSSIMDENPQGIVVKVNDRYPDQVPLSTMPPQVLKALPEMPEELEFRFVGSNLVILDNHAHIIADYIPNALPK